MVELCSRSRYGIAGISKSAAKSAIKKRLILFVRGVETLNQSQQCCPIKICEFCFDICPRGTCIAARIKSLAEAEPIYPPIDFEKAIAWGEGRTGKTLAPSQREALKTVFANRVVVITGGPGVGKTTLVNSILDVSRVSVGQRAYVTADAFGKRTTMPQGFDFGTHLSNLSFSKPGHRAN
jgi:hypothetical protein